MAVKRLNKDELNREAKKQNCKYYFLNNKIEVKVMVNVTVSGGSMGRRRKRENCRLVG